MATRDPRLRSKWWRLTHLYKIKDKYGQVVFFRPNFIQLAIIALLGKFKRLQILKYRQGGVTTLFSLYYLDDAIWNPGFSAAIIAHEREALDKIFQIIEFAFDNMKPTLKPTTRQDTLRMLRFESSFDGRPLHSSIYVALKLRGGTVQALHVSERAYIQGQASQELEAGSKQAVPLGGRITEETTANGFDEFHDSFTENFADPEPGPMDTKAAFFAWHEQAEYTIPGPLEITDADLKLKQLVLDTYGRELTDGQLNWYNWKMKDLLKAARASEDKVSLSGKQLMMQEYPTTVLEAFQSGLGSVFDQQILATIAAKPPIEVILSQNEKTRGEKIYIWHKPVKAGDEYIDENEITRKHIANKFYGVGCDPSDGTGGDDAGVDVWDEDYNQCAQWYGQLRPDLLAELVAEIGRLYNDAYVGVENNMLSTILFLSKIYENYFVTVTVDKKTNTNTRKIGWTTTGKSRDIMIDDFIKHYEEGTLEINSARTLGEMRTFVRKEGGKREHATGKKDDVLFGGFIGVQMVKYKDRSKNKTRVFAGKPQGL